MPIVFLETGFHFAETLAYRDEIVARYGLNLREMRAATPREEFAPATGELLERERAGQGERARKLRALQPVRVDDPSGARAPTALQDAGQFGPAGHAYGKQGRLAAAARAFESA